jgi:aryl-alcohol dehydrogenase-like predicted oxidoreductase
MPAFSKLRQLGKNGPLVSAIGFGQMALGTDFYGAIPSDEERFAVMDRAYELGMTMWDSAE